MAIAELKRAIQIDRKFAEAYNRLALIYMEQKSVTGRIQADRLLRQALRLDRKNVEYNLNLGILYFRREMDSMARDQFKKVLKLDPSNAVAYYYLGRIKEKDMLHYKDMIDNSDPDGVIYFQDFANDFLKEALEYYRKALERDSQLIPAYFRMALIFYELGQYRPMARLLRRALRIKPDDKNCHLFLGLAYHRLGYYDLAFSEYEKARALMSSQERAFYDSIEPLLSPQEEEFWTSGDSLSRYQFQKAFWKSRDPLYLTPYNERLLEHYGRIAYANLRFSFPEKKIEGWQTDRGKVYIRFGEPWFQLRTRPWVDVGHALGRSPLHPSREIWRYPDFDIVFEDRFLSGNYAFAWGDSPYNDYKYIFNRIIRETPDLYEHDYGGERFDLLVDLANFQGTQGQTDVETFVGVPSSKVHYELEPGPRITTTLKKGLFVFNEQWEEIQRRVEIRPFDREIRPSPLGNLFLDREVLRLPPGTYHLALEFLDERSRNVGLYRETLTVPSYQADTLQLSDLVLAHDIRLLESPSRVSRNSIEVTPNFTKEFKKAQDVFIYYEIYGLTRDPGGQTRFVVESILNPTPEESPLVRLVKKLLPWREKLPRLATSFQYQGTSETERHFRILRWPEAKPGRYELILSVRDLNSGQQTRKSVRLRITE